MTTPRLSDAIARRALERAVADKHEGYVRELDRIVEATYAVIERTGTLDPPLRDVLREAGISTQAFYRYFSSKDELLLVLVDNGRRRLLSYLEHRMAKARTPETRVRAWIEGVLAQATAADADRTRPFVADVARVARAFPAEIRASVDVLVDQLEAVVSQLPGAGADARLDAKVIYELTFGTLHTHMVNRTKPTAAETAHIVRFCLAGVAASSR